MRRILFVLMLFTALGAGAEVKDTLRTVNLQDVNIVSSIKDNSPLRQQAVSATVIGRQEMDGGHVASLKDVTPMVPNFFMPDYGSRLTSAIYIRGIGSRINTPAVGLYVDNIPYVDKSAFDFNFYDIERVDVLRGPQGTLYGRNTMGGLVRVYTKNPMHYTGTDVKLGYATGDNHRSVALTHYHRVNDTFAFTGGGYYEGGSGFFKHDITGKRIDKMQAGGVRVRGIYNPQGRLSLDFNVCYDYTDEGAYPYFYTGSVKGDEGHPDLVGRITNNREGSYRRGMLNAGVNVEYKAEKWMMNAVTGYQNIADRLYMDQDFIAPDIYTLEQKQRINTINEEIIFRNTTQGRWQWQSGVNVMHQWLKTDAPVTFYEEGVSGLIEKNVNGVFEALKAQNPRMPEMGLTLQNRNIEVAGNMKTPTFNVAMFHQSDVKLGSWTVTAGLRLEYESLRLDYKSGCDVPFDFRIQMSPTVKMEYQDLKASPLLNDRMKKGYWQLLPKLAVKYELPKMDGSNMYASISRGYRSGGYNIQMFSDLVQGEMRSQMMQSINAAGNGVVEKMMGADRYNELLQTMDASSVEFKPEYSWNYEVGTHLSMLNRRLSLDAAVFYSRIYDQQVARFAPSGLGRMMMNASISKSMGGELALHWTPDENLSVSATYGYTRSKFIDYDDGNNDYSGNYVPFVPMHNMNIDAAYTFRMKKGKVSSVTVGANCYSVARLYWTESNSVQQPFYATLGARVAATMKNVTLTLWGKNLTNRRYNTFYFESASRGYEQHGKPLQVGIDATLHF